MQGGGGASAWLSMGISISSTDENGPLLCVLLLHSVCGLLGRPAFDCLI